MAGNENQKLKPFKVLQILKEKTDDTHILNANDIATILEKEYGIKSERKSIYNDIAVLQNAGYDIELAISPKRGYYMASREFDLPELKILVDAVQSSQFVSKSKSEGMVKKLCGLTNKASADRLKKQTVYGKLKTQNQSVLTHISQISDAILDDKKISFKYLTYNTDKKLVAKYDGKIYEVSPYGMVWRDDRYYLVADSGGNRFTYRIDRMKNVSILDEKREPLKEAIGNYNFKITEFMAKYCEQKFSMFSGEETKVKLRFANRLMDVAIDFFGIDVSIENQTDETFEITAKVSFSPTFIAWITGFGGDVQLLAPIDKVEELKAHISKVLNTHK